MSCRSGFAREKAGALRWPRPSNGLTRRKPPMTEDASQEPVVEVELDEQRALASTSGRRGWVREGRQQLDQRRASEQLPVKRSRRERLLDAKRRLEEAHAVELAANRAYEAHHANKVRQRRATLRASRSAHEPPAVPEGRINMTDPDSRVMRTKGQPTIQGYNAQAAVTEKQIIVAAEITIESPDFGHLEPVFDAALRNLEQRGVSDRPGIVVADAGYWHKRQMENIVSDGTQVLIPPDSDLKENTPSRLDRRAL